MLTCLIWGPYFGVLLLVLQRILMFFRSESLCTLNMEQGAMAPCWKES